MPSFDVVSEIDLHQLTNAVDQAGRVVANRFDFKGVEASFEREERTVTLRAEADFQLSQMVDMLRAARPFAVFARVAEGRVLLDARSLLCEDLADVAKAVLSSAPRLGAR